MAGNGDLEAGMEGATTFEKEGCNARGSNTKDDLCLRAQMVAKGVVKVGLAPFQVIPSAPLLYYGFVHVYGMGSSQSSCPAYSTDSSLLGARPPNPWLGLDNIVCFIIFIITFPLPLIIYHTPPSCLLSCLPLLPLYIYHPVPLPLYIYHPIPLPLHIYHPTPLLSLTIPITCEFLLTNALLPFRACSG